MPAGLVFKDMYFASSCRSRLADFFTNCQPESRSVSSCLKENYADCLLAYSGLIGKKAGKGGGLLGLRKHPNYILKALMKEKLWKIILYITMVGKVLHLSVFALLYFTEVPGVNSCIARKSGLGDKEVKVLEFEINSRFESKAC